MKMLPDSYPNSHAEGASSDAPFRSSKGGIAKNPYPSPPHFGIRRPERGWLYYKRLAELLISMREGLHMSYNDFARALNLRVAQLQRLEVGEMRLSDRKADELGKLLYALAQPQGGH